MGVMLLTEPCVRVLGGRVVTLADAWEAKRQYAGLCRPDDDPHRPTFHPFDPNSEAASAVPASSLQEVQNPHWVWRTPFEMRLDFKQSLES
jgi:hypothetical protein